MFPDEVKRRLQQHFTDGLVVVVGSGLSCAEGLPGMDELQRHLCRVINPGSKFEDVQAWGRIEPLLAIRGLESALLECPPSPGLESLIVGATGDFIREKERAVIADIFSGNRKLRFTRLIRHLLRPSSGIPIITTNYDRLIEIAVEEAGIGADTMFFGRFAGSLSEQESRMTFCHKAEIKNGRVRLRYQPRARIFKPHGSLDWYFRDGKPVSHAGDLSGLQRLIITPGQNKFRNGYESPFDLHRSRANEAIDAAARILILGYGFNDDHLETHLTPAIRMGKPTVMLTYNLSSKALEFAQVHANVIAMDRFEQSGQLGTRLIIDRETRFYPGIDVWDVNSFVTGILE